MPRTRRSSCSGRSALAHPPDRRGAVPAQPDQADPASWPTPRKVSARAARHRTSRPRGAREVRRAAEAFLEMKARVERSMEQRTAMLAGVSHDLRTILTRFKLELALIGDGPDLEAPCAGRRRDVDDARRIVLHSPRGDSERAVAADRHVTRSAGRAALADAERHGHTRNGGVRRPARGDGEARFVQALPRQPRHKCRALRQHHLHHRPSRPPLSDRHHGR